MKNKTKIMLGLAALTAGTLAAGATGTFAWFTTNKTATATYSNIVAVGTSGKLNAAIVGLTDSDANASASVSASVSTTASKTSDVSSSDGKTFAKPDWVSDAGNDKAFNKIDNVSSKAGYFTQFLVKLTNVAASGTEAIKPILTGIEITNISGGQYMASWTRVAIYKDAAGTSGTGNCISSGSLAAVYQNSTTATYVTSTSDSGAKLNEGDQWHTDANITIAAATGLSLNVSDTSLAASNASSVATVGVSVWLEGTLESDQDNALLSTEGISVKLTFSSSNA